MIALLKFMIVVVMTGIIPVTGIIYWGATNLTGKASILSTGTLLYFSLAFCHSWLSVQPASFRDWLKK
ncbi:hypothetical protein HNV11_13210 [Spirosoma taeanense]|uniref:Uncharacterized protein n=1 Tax=Spirosoma taeanense TaxID=2735870 RepID=A0A6M5Y8G5_9BACT|nr:hypothetical protein [Spirosoma taeanense]QJW90265.1 hypothetical protein HNV11_13210 [Spirosoma taeanense]